MPMKNGELMHTRTYEPHKQNNHSRNLQSKSETEGSLNTYQKVFPLINIYSYA